MRSYNFDWKCSGSLWRNRRYAASLKRRSTGALSRLAMGLLWSLPSTRSSCSLFTHFVFSVVFKARWNMESDSGEFALDNTRPNRFQLFGDVRAPAMVLNPSCKSRLPTAQIPACLLHLLSALFHG